MNRGYVKLWRKSLDNGWLQNHELWVFWCYCLLRANHKKVIVKIGFQEIFLLPGQFIFGRAQAAHDLMMTEWKIRACLHHLRVCGNLTIKTTNKFSIITILNWHIYQGDESNKPPAKPPTTHQQLTTDKNDKNKRKYIADFRISALISFFYDKCISLKGFKPSLDGSDGKAVKRALSIMSEDDIKQAITFYLESKKAEDCGITLKAALSTHSLNLWKARKESKENNPVDWRDKYPEL
jgi:hypothetical protein